MGSRTIILAATLLGFGTTGAVAGVKIPLSAAMAQCERLSGTYSKSMFGQGGELVSDDQTRQYYRSCVRAKSGSYPPETTAKRGIRISGSAAFGLVYKQ